MPLSLLAAVAGLALLLCAPQPLTGARYSFRVFGEQQGLLNPIIRMIEQDGSGFLWVITNNGAYRFDGERLEYMVANGLDDPDMRWVHGARDGSVWFRGAGRLYRLRDGKFTTLRLGERLPAYANSPFQTVTSSRGSVWVLTSPTRLEQVNPDTMERKLEHEEPAGLWSIMALRDGSLLAGCGDRLCEASPAGQGWRRLDEVPADRYMRLHEARDGTVYARGAQRILRRRPGEPDFSEITMGLPPLAPHQQMPTLATDFHRRLLTNTERGLARLEKDNWVVIGDEQGLADQVVRSLFVDREGGIWLGTANGLLRWLGDGAWRLLGAAEGLPRRGADMAAQDRQGAVWVTAGPAGVYRGESQKGGTEWRFKQVEGLPAATALITVSRDNTVWLGPHGGGIVRHDQSTGRTTPVPGVDPKVFVHDFSIDGKRRVVAATSRGFYREREPGGPVELVWGSDRDLFSLSEDAEGAMWLGGDGVIARVRGSDATVIASDDGVEKNGVRAIHAGADGRIWTGTWRGDGLRAYRLEGNVLRNAKSGDTQTSLVNTFFIRRDRRNRVWTGTVRGIALFEFGRWHQFGRPQGLGADQCTNACFLRDGSIWFATSAGLAQYTPPLDLGPLEPPMVVLKSVETRFGPMKSGVGIPARESDLTVDYSVLSTRLEAPPEVRYRLGPKDAWRPARRRPLEFLNLAPGDYRLELAALGLNGLWSDSPVVVPFRVMPNWWQSWWFALAGVSLAGSLGALVWRGRLRAAQRENFERVREMVDQYPGVVFLLDRAGRFVLANHRLEAYTFQPRGGLAGKRPRQVMTARNAAKVEQFLKTTFEKGEPWQYREAFKVPTGLLMFEVRAFPLRDSRGNIQTICAFATDVTDRWSLEMERDQARQRYEAFVRQSTEAIWRLELEPPIPVNLPPKELRNAWYERAVIREANGAAASFLKMPVEEMIGRRFREFRDRHDPRNIEADIRWYKNGFTLQDFESTITDAQGNERVFLANTVTVVEDGMLVRSWSTHRDVTEQRRLQAIITNTARGVSAETGERLFHSLVEHLTRSLAADGALVAERLPDGRMRTIARWRAAAEGANGHETIAAKFGIEGTPLAELTETQVFGAAELEAAKWLPYPAKTALAAPLITSGEKTGLLMVTYSRAATVPEQARPAVEIFAARAAAELDRLRIEREVLQYQEQLRALASHNQQLMEKERTHLAREIHDELGQHLTAIKIGLSTLRSRLTKGESERALGQISDLSKLTDETVRSVRRISTELRPPAIDQLGLAAAIRWQAKETEQRLGIPVDCDLDDVPMNGELAITAFRILQESVTNIMRHAHASLVEVRLRRNGEDELELEVRDDGDGFDPSARRSGSLGLLGMSERAAAVGGSVEVESKPGEGTRVRARLPLSSVSRETI